MTGQTYPAAPSNRVFSGIQPTGNLTLGNYLGAIRNWVPLQQEYDCLYCIVDLHAITMFQEPKALHDATRQVAAALIACGIDPSRHILFNQSLNPDHAELAWYFNCVARMGWLSRMTQFKEKAGKDRERASAGLYFPEIEPLILGEATRVMSLRDGSKKMSKSDPSDMSRINLTDTADQIAQKIRKAKTDPEPLPSEPAGFEGRPEARNLVTIYAALTDSSVADALAQVGGLGFGDFKQRLAEAAVAHLSPITEEMNRLLADPAEIDRTLFAGGEKARALSQPVIAQVRDILGFVHPG